MTGKTPDIKRAWTGMGIAAALWFIMFSPWTAPKLNFWITMFVADCILIVFATKYCREWLKDIHINPKQIVVGIMIAVALWAVFWIGDKLSQMIFGFAGEQIDSIYAMKNGSSTTFIAIALLVVIGPVEEIFWRGFVQRRFMQRYNKNVGFIIATACYALIHIWSFNFILIMAALVAGFSWGIVYRFFPKCLTALVISHALWDACAFVIFPF